MKKRIALLYGGAESEHDVSLMGYEYVSELLHGSEYEILPIYVAKDGKWSAEIDGEASSVYPTSKHGGSLYTERGFIKPDCAIPLLHGEGGEDGSVQGALECAGIPYIGANVITSAICLDKAYTKAIASSLGIPTLKGVSPPRYESTEAVLKKCKDAIGFPMFIKPRRLGSSVGAYPVSNESDFHELYTKASEIGDGLVMVERCLKSKRELECAFVEVDGKAIITPPGEILIDGFYGYNEKYGGKTHTAPRAEVDESLAKLIAEYSTALAEAVMLRHLGRIDFFVFDGEVYFNEINTFPGFTKESLYPKMLMSVGIDPKDAMISFIEDALFW